MRLPGSEKVIVGYDLGNKYAQISCYVTGSEEEIRTLSSVAGSSVYTIPLALSKRQGVNQWFYGSEAIRYAGEEEGILVENLLKLARDGEPVQIDGAPIDPVALLTLFPETKSGSFISGDKYGTYRCPDDHLRRIGSSDVGSADSSHRGTSSEDGSDLLPKSCGELLLL